MSMEGAILDKTERLVTVTFTQDGKTVNRNYSIGDHAMLSRTVHGAQMYFLHQKYGRRAKSEYSRNKGQYEAEALAITDAIIAEEAQ